MTTVVGAEGKRFFVGNISPQVVQGDLETLFGKFGAVKSVEIKSKNDVDGNALTTFAFVEVVLKEGGRTPADIIKAYNGVKWKSKLIKVQVAQESFLQRLARERSEKIANFSTENDPSYNPMEMFKSRESHEVKPTTEKKTETSRYNEKKSFVNIEDKKGYNRTIQPVKDERAGGDGKVKNGVVAFDDDDKVDDVPTRKRYYSSSDEDETQSNSVPVKPKMRKEKRKYHSSSEEEETTDKRQEKRGNVMSKLESFAGGFWGEDEDTKDDRTKDSDSKRRSALNAMNEERKRKNDLIKASLNKVDKAKKSKLDIEKDTKVSLFNDESEEDEEENSFKIKSQFQGKSGQKLLQLQSKIAVNDDRFKLDGKFAEDDESSEESSDIERAKQEEENEITAEEKQRNLSILEGIVGTTTTAEKPKKRTVMFKEAERFDPTDESHQKKYEINDEEDESESSADESETVTKETPLPSVENDKKYWLKTDIFAKKDDAHPSQEQNKSFSFGFGKKSEDEKGADKPFSLLSEFEAAETIKRKKNPFERNVFKYDSSDSEEEEEKEEDNNFGLSLAQKSASSDNKPFFLTSANEDWLVAEVSEFLDVNTCKEGETRAKFEALRPELKKSLKKKAKKHKAMEESANARRGAKSRNAAGWKKGRLNRGKSVKRLRK